MVNFTAQIVGTKSSRKSQENAKQQLSHVESFVKFMAAGDPDPPASLHFLDDQKRLYEWVKELRDKFKVTTCRHYLMDVLKFFDYLFEHRPDHVHLRWKQLRRLKAIVKAQLKAMAAAVVTHRQVVKAEKMCRILSSDTLQKLLCELRQRIPYALGQS